MKQIYKHRKYKLGDLLKTIIEKVYILLQSMPQLPHAQNKEMYFIKSSKPNSPTLSIVCLSRLFCQNKIWSVLLSH